MKERKIGDHVVLHFDEPSAIGYNGILCEIKMIRPERKDPYFCESIYGTATCWASEENFVK